jgi:His/Glu/Gln/Arg/opine family amino acid ABC transporter permease subunit
MNLKASRIKKGIAFLVLAVLCCIPMSVQASSFHAFQELLPSEMETDPLATAKIQGKLELESWVQENIRWSDYSLENQEILLHILETNLQSIEEATNQEKITWSIERAKRNMLTVLTIEQEIAQGNLRFYDRYIKNTTVGRIVRIVQTNYLSLLKGLLVTLQLAVVTVLVGSFIGTVLALMRLSKRKITQKLSSAYVEFVRGIPLLLQLVTIYLLLFNVLGQFWAVAVALIVNSSAYVAEIVRSGIQAVDIGQTEAAKSLGMGYHKTMKKVVLPQAIKNILPALGNEFVTVIKETSLAATFYIGDLMTVKNNITSLTYLALEPFVVVGIVYFMCTFTLSKGILLFEKRLMKSD